jgi:predicted transglutaminase-like cysteine proteinase
MPARHLLVLAVALSATFGATARPTRDASWPQALTGPAATPSAPREGAVAMPVAVPAVTNAGPARPMAAWLTFCKTYPAECRVDPAEPETIRLTAAMWREVVRVNREVNASVRPLTDQEHWNVVDRWDFAEDGAGDCEDYQLLKRRKLMELGLPRRAMPMTVVLDERNEGHAVLMLRTDRGDFILDNKRDEVLSWQRTGYVYVKRESQTEVAWTSLNHVSGVTATAAR